MKSLFCTLLLAAGALSAFGEDAPSYLYWMLTDDLSSNPYSAEFSFARIKVDNTQEYVGLAGDDLAWQEAVGVEPAPEKEVGTTTKAYWANLGSFTSGYSYVLELYLDDGSDDGCLVGKSGPIAYADLAGFLSSDADDPTKRPAAAFEAWQVVPEPTSGLLVMLGVAGLALRRKRA